MEVKEILLASQDNMNGGGGTAAAAEKPAYAEVTGEMSSISLQTGSVENVAAITMVGNNVSVPRPYFARNDGDDLKDFFRRPRPIYTFSWTTGSAITDFKPWTLFMTNTAVAQKLNNYYMYRSNLKVICLISAQPQLYGALRISYLPFQTATRASRLYSINAAYPPQTFFLNAASSAGFCFDLPFFYPNDWKVIRRVNAAATTADDLGTIRIVPLAPIARADGTAPGTLDVQFYAWAEDVHLAGPTYVSQSKEVTATGPISGPASSVAKVAGYFRDVPVIGPFARATEIGSSAIGGIAKLFGYSRPVPVDELTTMSIRSWGQMSTTVGRDHVNKLSADPKQELTIDPRSVGLSSDEMNSILSMASQESQLLNFDWATTHATKQCLAVFTVHPKALSQLLSPTNLCWVSFPFAKWTGTLIYRFRVFSSPFQRGRLIVSFDPTSGVGTPPDMGLQDPDNLLSTNRFCVLDLATDTDVEFSVGWAQPQQWGKNNLPTFELIHPAPIDYADNGVVGVFVDAPLTSPGAAQIRVNVTVRAGPDFAVAEPTLSALAPYMTQSALVNTEASQTGDKAMKTCELYPSKVDLDAAALAHFGERQISARALAKRYAYVSNIPFALNVTASAKTYRNNLLTITAVPIEVANTTYSNNAAMFGTNTVSWTWASWWTSMHAGMRGGMRYKLSHNIPPTARVLIVITRGGTPIASVPTLIPDNWFEGVGTVDAFNTVSNSSGNGCMIVDAHQPGGIEFEIPWQWHQKFLPTWQTAGDTTYDYPVFSINIVSNQAYVPTGLQLQLASAAAEDFTPFYFLGAPGYVAYPNTYVGTYQNISG